MTSALLMLALLTAMEGRQDHRGSAERFAGRRIDLLGDDLPDLEEDMIGDDLELAAELHMAMFGDWTIDTTA